MAPNKSPKKTSGMSALELAMMEAAEAVEEIEPTVSDEEELEVIVESEAASENATRAIETAMNVFADAVATDDLPTLTVEGTDLPPSSAADADDPTMPIVHLDDQMLDQMIQELDRGAAPPKQPEPEPFFHAESLKVELDRTRTRLESLTNDFNRFKKRTEKQQGSARENIIADIVGRLLPLIDNLDRAVLDEAVAPEENVVVLQEGISMMTQQFRQIMLSLDVREVETTDAAFDPSKHDAMEMVFEPSVAEGIVLDCIQKGYSLPTRLIRPAKVRVSTQIEATPKPATNEHIASQLKDMESEEEAPDLDLPPEVPGADVDGDTQEPEEAPSSD